MKAQLKEAPSIWNFESYREYLMATLEYKKSKSKTYSIRAFSKSVGLSPSTLNNVFSRKRSMSPTVLIKIGNRLKLEIDELSQLLLLCASEDHSDVVSLETKKALSGRSSTRAKEIIRVNESDVLLFRWYVPALIESLTIPSLNQDLKLIASRLEIPLVEIEKTLKLLLKKKVLILAADGKYNKTAPFLQLLSENPRGKSQTLLELNKKLLQMTIQRITPETTQDRYLGFETFGFSKEYLPEAKLLIDRCLDDLAALSAKCVEPTTVYHSGVQLIEVLIPKKEECVR